MIAAEHKLRERLRTVHWYTAFDFARLVEQVSRGVPVVEIASRVVEKLINGLTLAERVTFAGHRRQIPARRQHAGPSDLLEAANWFLVRWAQSLPSPNVAAAASRSEAASADAPPG